MEGTIKKIYLKNFVTYDEVSVSPCENLNVIIGPNGTGKSTLVSAIMLGLGEKPTTTGRGKKAEEFIKTGCQEAKIVLDLNPDHLVERRITADGKSTYKLNGRLVSEKDINAFTKQLNIQVGNLCQFLPQDRVSEFARMNNKELLINTEKAVGGDELVNLHEELIRMQSNSQHQGGDLEKMESSLAAKREQNARLDVDVTALTEKNNLLLEIGNCKKLLLWLQYEEARAEHTLAKSACAPKEKAVQDAKAAAGPLQRQKTELELKYQEIKDRRKKSARSYDVLEARLKSKLEDVQEAFLKVRSLENNNKRNADKEMARVEKIQSLQQDIAGKNEAIAEMEVALTERKRQLAAITKELDGYGRQITNLDEQIRQIKAESSQYRYESQGLKDQIASVENVFSQKLELLRRIDDHAHRSVLWLQANRHLFRGTVYLPLMIELNVNDRRCANYLENAIGPRDLIAFACECAEDVNLLTNELRIKQRLRVNILSTDTGPIQKQSVSTEEIKRMNFDGYLDEYIDGPEPIKRLLRASKNLHRIPVSHREIPIETQMPPGITRYYTDGSCVSITGSKYCNEKLVMENRVHEGRFLLISQNVSNLDAQRSRLSILQEKLNTSEAQVNGLLKEKEKLNEVCAQKRNERCVVQQAGVDLNSAKFARDRYQQQLDDLQREQQTFLSERANLQKKVYDLVKEAVSKQVAAATHFENVRKIIHDVKMAKIEESVVKIKLGDLDNDYKAHQKKIDEAVGEFDRAKAHCTSLLAQAKKIFEEAKKETEGYAPADESFKKFETIFKTFPQTISELEELIDQKNALVACKRNVDSSVLTEYQARAREIEQLEKDIRKKEEDIANFKSRMTRIRAQWMQTLTVLVNKISQNFSKYFREINCAGDVVLEPGKDEHDYKNYGLSIKVSYRESAPLKELDQFTQSGGERAVATALYMISLQELTKVPFRCVDEINQGMDETNERRVYQLLMSITSSHNTSQYFLLTPKLLKGIEYSNNCMVHCVFNGPHVLRHTEWKIDKFLNRKRHRMDSD